MIQDVLTKAVKHASAVPIPSDLVWLTEALGPDREEFEETLRRQLNAGKRDLAMMQGHGLRLRREMLAAFSEGEVESGHIALLSSLIEAIEERAHNVARDIARQTKQLARVIKKVETHDAALRPFLQDLKSALEEMGRGEVEEKLDFALFLRALRAEHEGATSRVMSFSAPDELSSFLRQALA